MEFRLIYKGRLPAQRAGAGRTSERHSVRKIFHLQLKELWKQHPDLRAQSESVFNVDAARQIQAALKGAPDAKPWLEHVADSGTRLGTRFVPLISKQGGFTCSLEVLFLRRDNPGNLVASGGDIDNRIKVLLDALKMPDTVEDLGGIPIGADENHFYCLLQDDCLITELSVITDRLLTPQEADENLHDVHLVIHVTMRNPSAVFAGNRLV